MASEMLYPIMPIYLQSIGFSVLFIGILEGLAEAIAGLSKGYFGKLSDTQGKRLPFVQLGYTLSAISKPLLALFTNAWWVLFARSTDRLGKGIRSGARDALLSEEATPETKGRVFGFHRSMDTFGAVLGPLLALVFLSIYPGEYKWLFLLAFLPGCVAIGASFLLREKKRVPTLPIKKVSFFSFIQYWKHAPREYKRMAIGFLGFALLNSSDVFLLLKAKQMGLPDSQVIGVYIFYNLIYALAAFPLGKWADKVGFKKMFMFGLVLFSIVYLLMGFSSSSYVVWLAFLLYGLFAAATEGVSKAWLSNTVAKEDLATALGTYTAFQSLAMLLASAFAGYLWYSWSATVPFLFSGLGMLIVMGYFLKRKLI